MLRFVVRLLFVISLLVGLRYYVNKTDAADNDQAAESIKEKRILSQNIDFPVTIEESPISELDTEAEALIVAETIPANVTSLALPLITTDPVTNIQYIELPIVVNETVTFNVSTPLGQGFLAILKSTETFCQRNLINPEASEEEMLTTLRTLAVPIARILLQQLRILQLDYTPGKPYYLTIDNEGGKQLPIIVNPAIGADFIQDACLGFCLEFADVLGNAVDPRSTINCAESLSKVFYRDSKSIPNGERNESDRNVDESAKTEDGDGNSVRYVELPVVINGTNTYKIPTPIEEGFEPLLRAVEVFILTNMLSNEPEAADTNSEGSSGLLVADADTLEGTSADTNSTSKQPPTRQQRERSILFQYALPIAKILLQQIRALELSYYPKHGIQEYLQVKDLNLPFTVPSPSYQGDRERYLRENLLGFCLEFSELLEVPIELESLLSCSHGVVRLLTDSTASSLSSSSTTSSSSSDASALEAALIGSETMKEGESEASVSEITDGNTDVDAKEVHLHSIEFSSETLVVERVADNLHSVDSDESVNVDKSEETLAVTDSDEGVPVPSSNENAALSDETVAANESEEKLDVNTGSEIKTLDRNDEESADSAVDDARPAVSESDGSAGADGNEFIPFDDNDVSEHVALGEVILD